MMDFTDLDRNGDTAPPVPAAAVPVAWRRVSKITGKCTGLFETADVELRTERLEPLYLAPGVMQ